MSFTDEMIYLIKNRQNHLESCFALHALFIAFKV